MNQRGSAEQMFVFSRAWYWIWMNLFITNITQHFDWSLFLRNYNIVPFWQIVMCWSQNHVITCCSRMVYLTKTNQSNGFYLICAILIMKMRICNKSFSKFYLFVSSIFCLLWNRHRFNGVSHQYPNMTQCICRQNRLDKYFTTNSRLCAVFRSHFSSHSLSFQSIISLLQLNKHIWYQRKLNFKKSCIRDEFLK